MNCTTTPMETLTDAVRLAFEKAMPSKVAAIWGHANGLNIAGWDTRTNEEYVTMVLATIISGGGATPQQDGWHAGRAGMLLRRADVAATSSCSNIPIRSSSTATR